MIGQEKLVSAFNNFTASTLPHSMLLIGEWGCGKHTLIKELSERFCLTYREIYDKINYDVVEELRNLLEPTVCIICSEDISEKEESALLKIMEEPPNNLFLVIVAETSSSVLPTIYNRCRVFNFEQYTKEQLMSICNNDNPILLGIANTPGKVLRYREFPLQEMYKLSNTIYDKVSVANIANILTIPLKIDFEGYNKFPMRIMKDILLFDVNNRVKANYPNSVRQYEITRSFCEDLLIPNINKRQLFEHFLYELKGVK